MVDIFILNRNSCQGGAFLSLSLYLSILCVCVLCVRACVNVHVCVSHLLLKLDSW